MAALAGTAVDVYGGYANRSASEFYQRNSELLIRRLKLTLTGQGGQTNTIGAHALGFELLIDCSSLFDDENNKGYSAVVDPVTNTIVLLDGSAAPAPVDVTSNAAYITVYGVPRLTPSLT